MSAAVQTIWCELLAATLADAGIATCVISPGSRSTPLVAALAGESRLELVTIIDERAAAFFALGAARATGKPAALVCTSGTAAAHYLPALVEASLAGVPMIAITADRPPELLACGASQTIDQIDLYGGFVRGAFDLGAPAPQALRGMRRTIVQAITLASGPHPGPVHLEVPLRKPLEPAAPSTDAEHALARDAVALHGAVPIAPPRLAPDASAITALAEAISAEPDGVIIAGALPAGFPREAAFEVARRTGYPLIAEAPSQLRFGPRPDGVVVIDHADLVPLTRRPAPKLVLQLGAEPVAASWPAWIASLGTAQRWVIGGATWADPEGTARVILGEPGDVLAGLTRIERRSTVRTSAWLDTWRDAEASAAIAAARAIEAAPTSEVAVLRAVLAAVPAGAAVQIGNSLPIRVVDHVPGGGAPRTVLSQRGAAGIDGLIASAAGATRAGAPVLLVLGDVSFAHDLGGLLAARCASAPLAILVIDNRGGQIFAGLPVAKAKLGAAFERHFITAPEIDPAVVAAALGARAVTATSPAAAATAVATALATFGVTVIHAPVSVSGAHDVRRNAIELFARGATP
ncbi:MAG: 2-succinyl-5-enolpyruvyl-6-hydroxy-3-cyclohexene-1-carboxylic-acid synthase [Deltaproteobacteria bacterium]|nr:2-succinyl-5-enolpyruvyl-6-hydroxy-3-cyclohexene-1-carboxylic-acid synthase [Deltaproteobacteria bacterium]